MKFKKATLIEFDKKNLNDRIYRKENFDSFMEELSNGKNQIYGELGQSSNMDISLKNVSHVINNITINDDGIYGDVEILNTPKGKEVSKLLEKNSNIGISSRGMGKITEDGYIEKFKLFTFDIVPDPSFANTVLKIDDKSCYLYKIEKLKKEWKTLNSTKDS